MPSTHYHRGADFERRIQAHLSDNGYQTWRTPGSKSKVDVLAIKRGQILFVQAKSGAAGLAHGEWNALYDLAAGIGAVPLVADRDGRRIRYRVITGRHAARSSWWPALPWHVDEIAAS